MYVLLLSNRRRILMNKDDLKKLLILQEKEERIFRLLREKENISKELSTLEKTLEDTNKAISRIQKDIDITKNEIETLNKKLQGYEKAIKKTMESLKHVKSKELYKNILREKSKTENAIINTKNTIKQHLLKLKSLEGSKELKNIFSKQKRTLEEINNLKEDLESIEYSISKAQKDIKDYKSTLDENLVDFYEDMKKRVQPVFVSIDSRACSYCGNVLPLDLYNKLVQNNISSFMCPNCQRIIYRQSDIIK